MDHAEIKAIITDVLKELHAEGFHQNCPLKEIEPAKIQAWKDMPVGAFRMVCMTWSVLSQFGAMVGKGIAIGLFIIVMTLLAIGGGMLVKMGIGK